MSQDREIMTWESFGAASRELAIQVAESGYEPDIILAIAITPDRVVALLADGRLSQWRRHGAAMDVDGNYWSAGPSAACVNCFSPEGKLLMKLSFPVPGPTMPAFAAE